MTGFISFIPNHTIPSCSLYVQDLFMEETEGRKWGVLFQNSHMQPAACLSRPVLSHGLTLELKMLLYMKIVTSLLTEDQVHTAIYKMKLWRKQVSFPHISHSEKKEMQNKAASYVSVLEQSWHNGMWGGDSCSRAVCWTFHGTESCQPSLTHSLP